MSLMHVSFDLETLGSARPISAIAQIGAVAFPDGDTELGRYDARFEIKVSLDDCLRHGLVVDEGAFQFWLFQPEDVRRSVFKGLKIKLIPALEAFGRWLRPLAKEHEVRLWSHSTFDPPILNNAYAVTGVKRPYPRTAFRDLTTKLEDVWGDKAAIQWPARLGPEHDALWDSVHQADTLKLALAEQRRARAAR